LGSNPTGEGGKRGGGGKSIFKWWFKIGGEKEKTASRMETTKVRKTISEGGKGSL